MKGFTFGADLHAFAKAIEVDLDTVHERVVYDIHNRVTERTPVDTGRARAAWQITVGEPSTFIMPEGVYGPPPPPPMPAMSIKDVVYITNNVPYIEYLEDGSSKQAPAGMVALSLAEIEAELALTTAALTS